MTCKNINDGAQMEQKFLNNREVTIICNSTDLKIVTPHSEEASCYYGKGTRWGTAATESDNYFDDYDEDRLIYIIDKKNNRKFTLYFEDEEFMDERNRPISLMDFSKQYPSVIPLLISKGYAEEDTAAIIYDSSDLMITYGEPLIYYDNNNLHTIKTYNFQKDIFTVIDKINNKEIYLNFLRYFRNKSNNKIKPWDFCKQYPTIISTLIDLGELKKWKNGFTIEAGWCTIYCDMQMIYEITIHDNGNTSYRKYGKWHRIDGPAMIFKDSDEKKWYINGNEITNAVDQWLIENDYTVPFDKTTQQAFLKKFA